MIMWVPWLAVGRRMTIGEARLNEEATRAGEAEVMTDIPSA
jgi:hypothetical protein